MYSYLRGTGSWLTAIVAPLAKFLPRVGSCHGRQHRAQQRAGRRGGTVQVQRVDRFFLGDRLGNLGTCFSWRSEIWKRGQSCGDRKILDDRILKKASGDDPASSIISPEEILASQSWTKLDYSAASRAGPPLGTRAVSSLCGDRKNTRPQERAAGEEGQTRGLDHLHPIVGEGLREGGEGGRFGGEGRRY